MRLKGLEVFTFAVPFKVIFRHASASRSKAENLIVAAHSICGHVGYGEGCPRHYVTGETVESGLAFMARHGGEIAAEVRDLKSLRAWIEAHRSDIDQNPAAFCAIEIAILDLLGKIDQCPIEDVVAAPRLQGAFDYTAVLGDAPTLAYRWQFGRYWRRGFRDFKVKVSGNLRRDLGKVAVLKRKSREGLRARCDANNLWTSAEDCVYHLLGLSYPFHAIEEPLRSFDLKGFDEVGRECGAKIILDESVTRLEHLEPLSDSDRWIINLRVSKMGGLLRSLEVAEKALHAGIGIVVGAQVGETSILTRAALTVMTAARPTLVASEGAFGTHLLQHDLTTPTLMFGASGVLDVEKAGLRDDAGLGLKIRKEAFASMTPLAMPARQ